MSDHLKVHRSVEVVSEPAGFGGPGRLRWIETERNPILAGGAIIETEVLHPNSPAVGEGLSAPPGLDLGRDLDLAHDLGPGRRHSGRYGLHYGLALAGHDDLLVVLLPALQLDTDATRLSRNTRLYSHVKIDNIAELVGTLFELERKVHGPKAIYHETPPSPYTHSIRPATWQCLSRSASVQR